MGVCVLDSRDWKGMERFINGIRISFSLSFIFMFFFLCLKWQWADKKLHAHCISRIKVKWAIQLCICAMVPLTGDTTENKIKRTADLVCIVSVSVCIVYVTHIFSAHLPLVRNFICCYACESDSILLALFVRVRWQAHTQCTFIYSYCFPHEPHFYLVIACIRTDTHSHVSHT